MLVTYGARLSINARYVVTHVYVSKMNHTTFTLIATSIDVERLFSRGRLLLPHTRNGLSSRSTRALLLLDELREFVTSISSAVPSAPPGFVAAEPQTRRL